MERPSIIIQYKTGKIKCKQLKTTRQKIEIEKLPIIILTLGFMIFITH